MESSIENSSPPLDQPQPPEESKDLNSDKESVGSGDGWMDVLENGQLLKKVIHPGDTSTPRPERGNRATISLKTRVKETGAEVPSETFDKLEVFLGDYDTIHGVDLALALMHPGETSLVVIHPRFGYGEEGKAPDVAPNTTLECEVHLLSSEWIDTESTLPLDERISIGSKKKDRGNFWFGRKEYNSAIHCYRRAVEFLDATEDEMDEYHAILASNSASSNGTSSSSTSSSTRRKDKITTDSNREKERQRERICQLIDLRATAYNNLANSQMQTEALDQALKSVNSSLQLNEKNVKAWYRKGKILSSTGELVEAIEALKMALKLEPESRTIQSFLNELAKKRREELAKEKKLYQKMLQVDPSSVPSSSFKGRQHGGKWYSCLLSASSTKMGLVGGACSLIVVLSGILVYYFL